MPKTAREIGIAGEIKSAEYLENEGYEILERNYRCKFGEIDIIAAKSNTLLFVEVKTRKKGSLIKPEECVDKIKIIHMRNCANHYIQQYNLEEYDVSFDVISVIAGQGSMFLKHIRNCEI